MRPTGGDRRHRLPVPREQHRHEQLEPLQERIRSFSCTRALERQEKEGKARFADSNAFLAAGIPVE